MTQIPAVVPISGLPAGATPTGSELIEASQTTAGVLNSVKLTLAQAFAALGGIPAATQTGTLLQSLGTGFSATWIAPSAFVTAGTGIAIAGSTTLVLSVATGGITSTQMATGAITSTQIATATITQTQIATGAIGSYIDATIGSAQGDILYRNATSWVTLVPGVIGQLLQTQGAAANPLWAGAPVIKIQNFTTSRTYTASAGLLYAILVAGGASGAGGGVIGLSTSSLGGGGGGAGGLSIAVKSAAGIGASQVVTIGTAGIPVSGTTGGAGGSTSIGALCFALGGSGGLGNNGTSVFGGAGPGAAAGTGDIAVVGGPGGQGGLNTNTSILAFSGGGAPSWFGGGAQQVNAGNPGANPGVAGSVPGAGGSGGAVTGTTLVVAGGTGSVGQAFVIEFTMF